MRKTAFTLAEVLIALAIVGVIAALTLPNLMRLNQEAGIGPMLASVQTSVEEAAGRIILENPDKKLQDMSDDTFIGYLNKQLAMLKKNDPNETEGNGYALTNGAILNFAGASGSVPAGTAYKNVLVDINGKNLPNKEGVDKFTFTLSSHGLLAPQGCAKVISDNNWKVPKNYDPNACNPVAYTPAGDNGFGGGGGGGGTNCDLPKVMINGQCCDTAADPTCGMGPQSNCTFPYVFDASKGTCVCAPGENCSTACVKPSSCPTGTVWNQDKCSCECIEGLWTGSKCDTGIEPGEECTGGKVWSEENGRCECPAGTVEEGGSCVPEEEEGDPCEAGQIVVNGLCRDKCGIGFTMNEYGACIYTNQVGMDYCSDIHGRTMAYGTSGQWNALECGIAHDSRGKGWSGSLTKAQNEIAELLGNDYVMKYYKEALYGVQQAWPSDATMTFDQWFNSIYGGSINKIKADYKKGGDPDDYIITGRGARGLSSKGHARWNSTDVYTAMSEMLTQAAKEKVAEFNANAQSQAAKDYEEAKKNGTLIEVDDEE